MTDTSAKRLKAMIQFHGLERFIKIATVFYLSINKSYALHICLLSKPKKIIF
jgi:hypothetical protein